VGDDAVQFTQSKDGIVLKIPAAAPGEVDRVIVLELAE